MATESKLLIAALVLLAALGYALTEAHAGDLFPAVRGVPIGVARYCDPETGHLSYHGPGQGLAVVPNDPRCQ